MNKKLKKKEINLQSIQIKDGNSSMRWVKIRIIKYKFTGRNMRRSIKRSRKK
jgi:hypothetical protein